MLQPKKEKRNLTRGLLAMPARLITLSFLTLIAVGTLLLSLPVASRGGSSIGLVKAFFTATSATCVTGLVTVDTATHWSLFGQIVILALIQAGGLGIVTITTFFFVLARRKIGFKAMIVAQESTASLRFSDVMKLVRRVVLITMTIEVVGAAVLATRFVPAFGWSRGIFKSIFHAVSAFCNAGFDLMGNTDSGPYSSLVAWNGVPVVLLTIAVLFILGGLGFIVINSFVEYRKTRSIPYHARLVLFLTGVFLVTGMAFFLLAEYNNTASGAMGTLPAGQRFLAAFFQSATPRTAGFNSIDQASLTGSSKIVTILLMFVGAAPGSTGGGIKVTTFAMLIAAVFAELRGYEYPVLLRHRIARAVFNKAFLILSLGFFTVLVTTVGMTFTERALLASGGTTVLDLLFEAVSAFGTVGLSAAGTPNLSQGSWLLLTVSMIVGRVGPASFAISLLQGPRSDTRDMVFPEGRCIVG